jgi:hypothetical protein
VADFELTCHLLIRGSDPGTILVEQRADGAALPILRPALLDGDTVVQALLRHLAAAWSLDPVPLEIHMPPPHKESRYHALAVLDVPLGSWAPPSDTAWRGLDAVPPLDERIAPRAATWVEEWRSAAEPPELRPAWSRSGWHRRATEWIHRSITSSGATVTGPLEIRRLWGISALIVAPTSAGSAWFKAVFPQFHHEPAVTELLARTARDAIPRVLATDPDEGWLLTVDAGRRVEDGADDDEFLLEAVHRLVTIQAASRERLAELARLGCPRRPLSRLAEALSAVMVDAPTLEGPTVAPARLEHVLAWVRDRASWLEDVGLPETIVHGDFHPGNVMREAADPVILDWSDAAVAHPLLEIGAWFDEVDDEVRRDWYWQAWLDALSPLGTVEPLRAARETVFGLAAAYQAVSYAWILRGIEPANRYQLSDGFRGFWSELDKRVPA